MRLVRFNDMVQAQVSGVPWIDAVMDFGAGNKSGVEDSTQAIQDAIDAATGSAEESSCSRPASTQRRHRRGEAQAALGMDDVRRHPARSRAGSDHHQTQGRGHAHRFRLRTLRHHADYLTIADLTIDADAAHQDPDGLQRHRRRRVSQSARQRRRQEHPWAKNETRGILSSSGVLHAVLDNCRAISDDGDGSAEPASSCGGAFDATFVGCFASGFDWMGVFQLLLPVHEVYVDCAAQLNTQSGFNNEYSEDTSYVGCRSGGVAPTTGHLAEGYSADENVGNPGQGFLQVGPCERTTWDRSHATPPITEVAECISTEPMAIQSATASSAVRSSTTLVLESASATACQAGAVMVSPETALYNNTTSAFYVGAPGPGVHGTGSGQISSGSFPAMPASGATYTSRFPYAVDVYIIGGTVTDVEIDGYGHENPPSPGCSPAPSSNSLYSSAPTWSRPRLGRTRRQGADIGQMTIDADRSIVT